MPSRNDQLTEAPEVLGLIVEWFDAQPQLIRQYIFKYFVQSKEVEMVDCKTRRLFLKRTACPEHITLNELFVGNTLNVFARILKVVDYADPYTRRKLQRGQQPSLVVVTPDALPNLGKIIDAFVGHNPQDPATRLQLMQLRMVRLTEVQGEELSQLLGVSNNVEGFVANMTSGPTVALALAGNESVDRVRALCGSLRQDYSQGGMECAVYWGDSDTHVSQLSTFFFSDPAHLPTTATFDNCTCCVIRPHAVKDGLVGKIVDHIIQQGYEVSAMQSFQLDLAQAQEFLEVYKGVVPEYRDMAEELTEGPCVALEVRAEQAVETFRKTVGPWDVEVAKELRPSTIRAKYGKDKVRSAVHCTDLPEDGELECRYFFELLQE